ncbi:hypothetical protein OA007_02260 [SAR116 cluster bacterium]|nr:hypothetical protein [SAR116 cluster bacterium]
MLSKKLISASQSGSGGGGGGGGGGGTSGEIAQAGGTAVSNTLLPSTVVCYTNGVSSSYGAHSIDGWYRATSGNLYTSTSLFESEGTGTHSTYGQATTYNANGYGLNSGYFSSMGYDINDASLIVYQSYSTGANDQRWQCNWVRDYLPDHLDSNTDSLCIEMFVNLVDNYGYYSKILGAAGHDVDSPAGFDLFYFGLGKHTVDSGIYWGAGGDRAATAYNGYSFARRVWAHVSYLWDFQNSRAAFHHNGTQVFSTTDSNLPTGATWSLASTSHTNSDTLTLGFDGSYTFSSTYPMRIWAHYMEVIVSVNDSTKQSRYGNSFTPSTTPLIAGG